jgi:hypothetical protein
MRKSKRLSPALIVAPLVLLVGCSSTPSQSGSQSAAPVSPAPTPSASVATGSAPPAPAQVAVPVPHDEQALQNVFLVNGSNGKLLSGAVPEGDAGFDELSKLGVKTVISVDGAAPDVARAKARGIRYVHVPVTYSDVTPDQQLEIARAIRDLPGPVYVHCHHGKHRGPAAAASAAVLLGYATPEQGLAFMKSAGTAANYQGLYTCVTEANRATDATLAAAPAEFPEVRKVEGLVDAMVHVDLAFEHIGEVWAAGWAVPHDHPDLVPAAEAGRLADMLRYSGEDTKIAAWGEAYQVKLRHAIAVASQLESEIVVGAPKATLDATFKLVQASCKDCHAAYRDNAAN